MRGLGEIDLARGADQPAVIGCAMDEEPGIDRDAMAADAGTRLEDVDARVTVGEADHLPAVDAQMLGPHRQDRKILVYGKRVSVRVALGGRRHTRQKQSDLLVSQIIDLTNITNK